MDRQLLAQALSLLGFIAWHGLIATLMFPAYLLRNVLMKPALGNAESVVFWQGLVHHVRRRPKANAFTYPVRTALVSLDNPPAWFSGQSTDHMTAEQARQYAGTTGQVWLLTNPISAGYTVNPISVYYCYGPAATSDAHPRGSLQKCIAEVTNTPWNERVTFVFSPGRQQGVKKALHVSPLMDMEGTWLLEARDPLESAGKLHLVVRVSHPQHGDFFYADLMAQREQGPGAHARNEEAGVPTLLRYGFQPHRIAVWIYWQAVVLLRKGLRLYSPPARTVLARAVDGAVHPLNQLTMCPFTWRAAEGWPWDTWGGKVPTAPSVTS